MVALVFLLLAQLSVAASESTNFTFNGFGPADLHTDGIAAVLPGGLLRLTNTTKLSKGHAFYPTAIGFQNSTTSHSLSFSTTFVFAMRPVYQEARDPYLGSDYDLEEMELVLKLGLLCSHPRPAARPVVQVLEGCPPLPEMVEDGWDDLNFAMAGEGFDGYGMEVRTSVDVCVDDRGSALVDRTGDEMSS